MPRAHLKKPGDRPTVSVLRTRQSTLPTTLFCMRDLYNTATSTLNTTLFYMRDLYHTATSTLNLHRDSNKIKLERGAARQGDNIYTKALHRLAQNAMISIRSARLRKEPTYTVSTFPTWSSPTSSSLHSLHKNCKKWPLTSVTLADQSASTCTWERPRWSWTTTPRTFHTHKATVTVDGTISEEVDGPTSVLATQ